MKFDWKYLSTFEPAVLRGVWVAIVGVLTAFGLQVSDTTHAKATALIAAAAIIVPLVQAFWTRQAVSPVAKLTELENAATTPMPSGPTLTVGTGATVVGGGNVTVTVPTGPTGPTGTGEPVGTGAPVEDMLAPVQEPEAPATPAPEPPNPPQTPGKRRRR